MKFTAPAAEIDLKTVAPGHVLVAKNFYKNGCVDTVRALGLDPRFEVASA